MVQLGLVLLILLGRGGASAKNEEETAGKVARRDAPVTRLDMRLRDGSRIWGMPGSAKIPFKSTVAAMDLVFENLRSMEFKDGGGQVEVRFQNGDRLQGATSLDIVECETLLGKISVPLAQILRIRIHQRRGGGGIPAEGLLLHLSFDEDGGERAVDSSGQEHHGKVKGARFLTEGHVGGAYGFDGSNGIHVDRLDLSSGCYTVSGWIRTQRPAQNADWRMWIGQSGDDVNVFHLLLSDGRALPSTPGGKNRIMGGNAPFWVVCRHGQGSLNLGAAEADFRDGKWHMVVATYDPKSQRLYTDGNLADFGSLAAAHPPSSSEIVIGGVNYANRHPWIGDIDDVMIFNRALDEDEVEVLHESQMADGDDRN